MYMYIKASYWIRTSEQLITIRALLTQEKGNWEDLGIIVGDHIYLLAYALLVSYYQPRSGMVKWYLSE